MRATFTRLFAASLIATGVEVAYVKGPGYIINFLQATCISKLIQPAI